MNILTVHITPSSNPETLLWSCCGLISNRSSLPPVVRHHRSVAASVVAMRTGETGGSKPRPCSARLNRPQSAVKGSGRHSIVPWLQPSKSGRRKQPCLVSCNASSITKEEVEANLQRWEESGKKGDADKWWVTISSSEQLWWCSLVATVSHRSCGTVLPDSNMPTQCICRHNGVVQVVDAQLEPDR